MALCTSAGLHDPHSLDKNGKTRPLQAEWAHSNDKMATIKSLSYPYPQPRDNQMSKDTSSNPREFKILRISPLSCSQNPMKYITPNWKITGEKILNTDLNLIWTFLMFIKWTEPRTTPDTFLMKTAKFSHFYTDVYNCSSQKGIFLPILRTSHHDALPFQHN